uniref:Transmembrane protein n=1 Tax=Syphacia muris TaxID=451379 RepID=A0A0N5AY12_9BILA
MNVTELGWCSLSYGDSVAWKERGLFWRYLIEFGKGKKWMAKKSRDNATSLRTLGCHKPVIPVVTFLTPLARDLLIPKGSIGLVFTFRVRTENQDQICLNLLLNLIIVIAVYIVICYHGNII